MRIMRKCIFVLVISIIGLIGVITAMLLFNANGPKVGNFLLDEYQQYMIEFSSDKILGKVPTAKEAQKEAEQIWIEKYGKNIPNAKKPYKVFFDQSNNVWLVTGSLHKNTVGGIPYVLIQKEDGKVLAIWHSK